jgi:hypothetical protein
MFLNIFHFSARKTNLLNPINSTFLYIYTQKYKNFRSKTINDYVTGSKSRVASNVRSYDVKRIGFSFWDLTKKKKNIQPANKKGLVINFNVLVFFAAHFFLFRGNLKDSEVSMCMVAKGRQKKNRKKIRIVNCPIAQGEKVFFLPFSLLLNSDNT